MGKNHRWPKSLHSQIEAVFSSVTGIGKKKTDSTPETIRSLATLQLYKIEAHSFITQASSKLSSILDSNTMHAEMTNYLTKTLSRLITVGGKYSTFENKIQALKKLDIAIQKYAQQHQLGNTESFNEILSAAKNSAKTLLTTTTKHRAYPEPEALIAAISSNHHKLMAKLQYEGGCRAEGVGAPSRFNNPFSQQNLKGITRNNVTGEPVGAIQTKEKGGKWTTHFISVKTYNEVANYLARHKSLSSSYRSYLRAINSAARLTAQYSKQRGTHGLKHSFAHRRFRELVRSGTSHEEARFTLANELSHNRPDIADYYLG